MNFTNCGFVPVSTPKQTDIPTSSTQSYGSNLDIWEEDPCISSLIRATYRTPQMQQPQQPLQPLQPQQPQQPQQLQPPYMQNQHLQPTWPPQYHPQFLSHNSQSSSMPSYSSIPPQIKSYAYSPSVSQYYNDPKLSQPLSQPPTAQFSPAISQLSRISQMQNLQRSQNIHNLQIPSKPAQPYSEISYNTILPAGITSTHTSSQSNVPGNKRSVGNIKLEASSDSFVDSPKAESNKKTKYESEDGRGDEKAKRSREASRRYRQRKKAVMEQMKQQMNDLIKEKEKLSQAHHSALELISSLKQENLLLKSQQQISAQQIEKERIKLLDELEVLMAKNNPQATDEEILELVGKIFPYCMKIHLLGQDVLARYITGDVTKYLLGVGFFSTSAKPFDVEVENPGKVESLANFVDKVFEELDDLTEEQKSGMVGVVNQFYDKLKEVEMERIGMNKELSEIVHARTKPAEEENMQNVLRIMASLDCLKRNLEKESNMSIEYTQKVVLGFLRPRQLGTFFMKVQFVHKSVQQLKAMWDYLRPFNVVNSIAAQASSVQHASAELKMHNNEKI